jgi:hypothetical protein
MASEKVLFLGSAVSFSRVRMDVNMSRTLAYHCIVMGPVIHAVIDVALAYVNGNPHFVHNFGKNVISILSLVA